jgi:hypothetical protein
MAKSIRKKPTKKKSTRKPAKKKTAAKKVARKAAGHAAGMHDAREVVHERRFEVRTLVSKVTFAALSFKTENFSAADYVFSVDISGLLVDTSLGGCSLVFMKANPFALKLKRDMKFVVQIAPEGPRLATLRWIKDLDSRLINAGFAFS